MPANRTARARDSALSREPGTIAVDPAAVAQLGDEIATLSAHIEAATHRLLLLIAEYDRLRGWALAGYASCADWLAARTQIDPGTAREKVRTARALVGLPLMSGAMSRGELTFSQARALTRCADRSNEAELLELARGTTTAQLERAVRAYRRGSRKEEADREAERYTSRTLSIFPDEDGMYVIRGRLMPEVAVLLMRAIEAASDALYREEGPPTESERTAAQRRADAIALLADRALATGFGAANDRQAIADVAVADTAEGCADVSVDKELPTSVPADTATPTAPPISGTRAARYQVMLHVDMATLSEHGEPGRSEFEDGTRVSCETSRRLSCDASVVRVVHDGRGSVLDVGRRTRTTPPALRRALEVRDRGCRFPGCGKRFTDAHHIEHWSQGGPTSLLNTMLVCGYHHWLLHEGSWSVKRVEDRLVFEDPWGGLHYEGAT